MLSSILKEDLNKHLSILASDEYEGRETAKPGQKKAARYISDQFRKFGVNEGVGGSYLQTFEVDVKNASNVFIEVNNNSWQLSKDFYYVGNLKDIELSNIGLIDAGYGVEEGEYSDYSNINVKGKFIIVRNGAPPATVFENDWYNWRRKVKLAEEKGAVGIITIKDKDDFKYGAENNRRVYSEPEYANAQSR